MIGADERRDTWAPNVQPVHVTNKETVIAETIRARVSTDELDHFGEDKEAAKIVPTAVDDQDLTYGEKEIIATATRAAPTDSESELSQAPHLTTDSHLHTNACISSPSYNGDQIEETLPDATVSSSAS